MMMTTRKALLTRPISESLKLQQKLELIGINSEISPALEIKKNSFEINASTLESYQAIIISSKYTARYLKNIPDNIPIYSIGGATTQSLEEQNLTVSATAEENSPSLYKLLKINSTATTKFIHIGGENISDNFQKYILNSDLNVDHVSVYQAVAQKALSPKAINALKNNAISTVFLFSPRSGEIFESLCEREALTDRLKTITALCLASTVVKSLGKNKWQAIEIANHANTASMIEKYTDLIKSQE